MNKKEHKQVGKELQELTLDLYSFYHNVNAEYFSHERENITISPFEHEFKRIDQKVINIIKFLDKVWFREHVFPEKSPYYDDPFSFVKEGTPKNLSNNNE